MSLLDHVHLCNRADMATFIPFYVENQPVGWIKPSFSAVLAAFGDVFDCTQQSVRLHPGLTDHGLRTEALDHVFRTLSRRGVIGALREELYACKSHWGAPEVFRIDRAVTPLLGLRAYGVHLNGWQDSPDGPLLWIGRRALDKKIAPGKLDNMVAGGQPAGLSLRANLAKEAAEEADVPDALIQRARSVGAITYCMEGQGGLKPDTMFCYDLQVPADFVPRNTDGEMVGFEQWPIRKALEVIAAGEDFKFNVTLVIIDFALRHGILTPDETPDYQALLMGLRRPHP